MKTSYVKKVLLKTISSMVADRSSFVRHPGVDFSRQRKCSFKDLILFLLTMEDSSLNRELRRFFPKSDPAFTKSAFCQQRAKLNDKALPFLLSGINQAVPRQKKLNGYHLVAVDGSDVDIPPCHDSPDTFVPSNTDGTGYHQMHLNAIYDLLEERYTDILVQPRASINERSAFLSLLKDYSVPGKTIFIADRGYFSLNILAHLLVSGHSFLLRLNSADIRNSFLKRFKLPDAAEFDVILEFDATRSKKKCYLAHPDKFVCLHTKRQFDFIQPSDKKSLFHFLVRLVKVDLPSGPEYLLTNLPGKAFSLPELKHLYHLRWGIETSFRFLKYNIALTSFHSIRRDFIRQEIYARVIMYNLTLLLTHTVDLPISSGNYPRKVSVSDAVLTCRDFLLGRISSSRAEKLLLQYLTEIRPDRSFQRKIRSQHYKPLHYRA